MPFLSSTTLDNIKYQDHPFPPSPIEIKIYMYYRNAFRNEKTIQKKQKYLL